MCLLPLQISSYPTGFEDVRKAHLLKIHISVNVIIQTHIHDIF